MTLLSIFALASANFTPIEKGLLRIPIMDDSVLENINSQILAYDPPKISLENIDSDEIVDMIYQLNNNMLILNANMLFTNKNVVKVGNDMWEIFLYQSLECAGLLLVLLILGVVIYYKIKNPMIKVDILSNIDPDIENQAPV